MSHIRNLFNPQSTSRQSPLLPADPLVAGDTTVLATPDFSVEQAHLDPEQRLIHHSDPHSLGADRFRYLRMRIQELSDAGKLKSLLITSPLANDGKTTILLNLATALSERGKRPVLVVEGDLHHPSVLSMFQLKPWGGLAELLQDQTISPFASIRRVEPFGWHLLPAGKPHGNPTDLLHTAAFGNVIQELSALFDWILIDSPPTLPLTDALLLHQYADGCLLTARAGYTPRGAVEQAIELLGPQKLVGVALNQVEVRTRLYYEYRNQGNNRH